MPLSIQRLATAFDGSPEMKARALERWENEGGKVSVLLLQNQTTVVGMNCPEFRRSGGRIGQIYRPISGRSLDS